MTEREQAEECLGFADEIDTTPEARPVLIAEAQVHATLALVDVLSDIAASLDEIKKYGIDQVGSARR